MSVVFRKQYDGVPVGRRFFHELEQIDEVERAGYRSTKRMVESLLAAGQRLVEFRASEFSGDMNPGPFQGAPDQVDLDARMDEAVQSGKSALSRVREATESARAVAHAKKVEEAKEFLKEANRESSSASPEGDRSS